MKTDKGLLVVVSAPSGCGKDRVITELRKTDFVFDKTVSNTTRAQREGEVNGVDYTFVDKKTFEERIESGYFLEYTLFSDNYYGTPKEEVEKHLDKGGCILLKIEVEGASNVRKSMPEAVTIFLVPPSMEELERRLRERNTETEESLKKRLEVAKVELTRAPEYDYIVINDNLDDCVQQIRDIIECERTRYPFMKSFVDDLLNN